VKWALGGVAPAPFFRFPALQHPPEMVTYLGTRNIAIFSCDLDSFDFKAKNAQQVIDVTMKKLDKLGKGIILLHDFHKHTARGVAHLAAQTEGRRLQSRVDEAQGPRSDPSAVRRGASEGHQTADREHAAGVQRGADDFGIAPLRVATHRRSAQSVASSRPVDDDLSETIANQERSLNIGRMTDLGLLTVRKNEGAKFRFRKLFAPCRYGHPAMQVNLNVEPNDIIIFASNVTGPEVSAKIMEPNGCQGSIFSWSTSPLFSNRADLIPR
jgi:hypothetical protein